MPSSILNLVAIDQASDFQMAILVAIGEDGWLLLRDDDGFEFRCLWLETGAGVRLALEDRLLALKPAPGRPGVALGRIAPYRAPQSAARVNLEATESLTLQCGEARIDLRADGKVMVRGEDVLLRAKGTQRIRAGNVAIN